MLVTCNGTCALDVKGDGGTQSDPEPLGKALLQADFSNVGQRCPGALRDLVVR